MTHSRCYHILNKRQKWVWIPARCLPKLHETLISSIGFWNPATFASIDIVWIRTNERKSDFSEPRSSLGLDYFIMAWSKCRKEISIKSLQNKIQSIRILIRKKNDELISEGEKFRAIICSSKSPRLKFSIGKFENPEQFSKRQFLCLNPDSCRSLIELFFSPFSLGPCNSESFFQQWKLFSAFNCPFGTLNIRTERL